MKAEATRKVKQLFEKKVVKVSIIGFIAVIVLGGIFFKVYSSINASSKSVVNQQTARVRRGDLSVTVTGSGPMNSANRIDITPVVSGTVTKVYFKEGDKVKKGALMFELDDTDAKLNVDKIANQIEQTHLSANNNIESIDKLSVAAPFSGVVSKVSLKEEDELNKGAPILTLTDMSKLKMKVPFNSAAAKGISPGANATVHIESLMQSIEGKVTYVSNTSYSTPAGGELYSVEITVTNPGSLKEGMKASAEIHTSDGIQSSADYGTLSYLNVQNLKSGSGGTVSKVNIKENEFVSSGQILVQLENKDLNMSKDTTDLKLKDLQNQLESAKKQLQNFKLYAAIDGTIVKQEMTVGTIVKSGEIMSTIADGGHMEFHVPVDELDIAKIKVGQKVNITVDALTETSNKPLTGEVSKIALEGTSSNGVTTYPVTVKVENGSETIKEGMNASAEVFVNSKQDILFVPIEAVQKMRGNTFVMVRGSGGSASQGNGANGGNFGGQSINGERGNRQRNNGQGNNNIPAGSNPFGSMMRGSSSNNSNYYANAVPKQVQVGINNDSYIEIISGLNEGDQVILPPVASSQQTNMRSPFGGGGGQVVSGGQGGGNQPGGNQGSGGQGGNRQSSGQGNRN
ncbi:MAG: HlyD family efflux transporter periplasmic adaptor subunit [Clostridia bacterium]|nr:HlyD family efflux transporter periplasmic adaptor subunit [Clostridia bacterium]